MSLKGGMAGAILFAACLLVACNGSQQTATTSSPTTSPDSSAGATTPDGGSFGPASLSDENAIRQAVEDHIRNNKGINLSAMNVSVDAIQIDGDQAKANATFQLKQGGTSMGMSYSLTRHARAWLVVSSQPANGEFVHPPMDKLHSSATAGSAAPSSRAPGSEIPDFSDYLKSQSSKKQN